METDYLGNGFEKETFSFSDDYEGKVVATLVRKKCSAPSSKAVLYVHGFSDYFFQTEMAEEYIARGYNFYALDLRKYGRSLLPHQSPNLCKNMDEYYEDIDAAVDFIRNDNNDFILLNGHSTGGLLATLYTHDKRALGQINALFLNSPFLDYKDKGLPRYINLLVIGLLGNLLPAKAVGEGLGLYGESTHKDYKGEWDFNTDWKPIKGFPFFLGWLKAIRQAHLRVQSGLDLPCPTLVMHSDKSSHLLKEWDDVLMKSDNVLDVEDIKRVSKSFTGNITISEIQDAKHDLVLSSKDVNKKVYQNLFQWLEGGL